jgi:hypothetical protein
MLSTVPFVPVVSADPGAAERPVSGTRYESAFEGYSSFVADTSLLPWREVNDRVNSAAAHEAHASSEELAKPDAAAARPAPSHPHAHPTEAGDHHSEARSPSALPEGANAPRPSSNATERSGVRGEHERAPQAAHTGAEAADPGRESLGGGTL